VAILRPSHLPLCLVMVACDPALPYAEGSLVLSPDIELADYRFLELRAYPDDGVVPGHSARPGIPAPEMGTASYPIEATGMSDYHTGVAIGVSDKSGWRVVGWLTSRLGSEWMAEGEPHGTTVFEAQPCALLGCGPSSGYCGPTEGVELRLHSP